MAQLRGCRYIDAIEPGDASLLNGGLSITPSFQTPCPPPCLKNVPVIPKQAGVDNYSSIPPTLDLTDTAAPNNCAPSSLLIRSLAPDLSPEPKVKNKVEIKAWTHNLYAYHDKTLKAVFFDTPTPESRLTEFAKVAAQKFKDGLVDLINLQEIWPNSDESTTEKKAYLWHHLLDELAKYGCPFPLDEKHAIIATPQDSPLGYEPGKAAFNGDIAIISRYPLSNVQFTPFIIQGETTTTCGKMLANEHFLNGIATAEISVPTPDGKTRKIRVVTTHTLHRDAGEDGYHEPIGEYTPERLFHMLQLHAVLEGKADMPMIGMGDINTNPLQLEYALFRKLFPNSAYHHSADYLARGAETFAADNPFNFTKEAEGLIDHGWTNGDIAHVDIFKLGVSDHYGVEMDVAFDFDEWDTKHPQTKTPREKRKPVQSYQTKMDFTREEAEQLREALKKPLRRTLPFIPRFDEFVCSVAGTFVRDLAEDRRLADEFLSNIGNPNPAGLSPPAIMADRGTNAPTSPIARSSEQLFTKLYSLITKAHEGSGAGGDSPAITPAK